MKKIKKAFRLFCLILFLIFAASGIGISNALSSNRERYMDAEIRREQVDKKEEDDEMPADQKKS